MGLAATAVLTVMGCLALAADEKPADGMRPGSLSMGMIPLNQMTAEDIRPGAT